MSYEIKPLFFDHDKYWEIFKPYLDENDKSVLLIDMKDPWFYRWTIEFYGGLEKLSVIDEFPDVNNMGKDRHTCCYGNEQKVLEEVKKLSVDKKFDKIIMNPPYDGNLHLKILEEAIKHLINDGVCINLSPIVWLKKPISQYDEHSDYTKFEMPVSKYIKFIEEISVDEVNKIFNIGLWYNLAIYVCSKSGGFDYKNYYKTFICDSFIEKVCKKIYNNEIPNIKDQFMKNSNYEYWVMCPRVHGHAGLKDYYDVISQDINKNLNKDDDKEGKLVFFKTKEEAINFHNSLICTFSKYIKYCLFYKTNVFYGLPFMEDYKDSWTNERFCKYFGITGFISDTEAEKGSEWEEILNTMKKYN